MSDTTPQIGEGLKKELASMLDKFSDLNSVRLDKDGSVVFITEPIVLESVEGTCFLGRKPELGKFAIAIHENSEFPYIVNLDESKRRRDRENKVWEHPHICEGIPLGEDFITTFGQAHYYGNWEHMLTVCLEFLRTAKGKNARAWQ